MTHISGSQLAEPSSQTLSNTSGVSVPPDAPEWSAQLFQKTNALEALVNDVHGTLGMMMGHVMQAKQEIQSVRGFAEVIAVRVARIDQDREISVDKLISLRKDVRKLREARATNPDVARRPDEQTTDERNALTLQQAEALIKAESDKRDRERELAEANAKLAALAAGAAERAESRKYWGRQVIGWLAIIVTGIVVADVAYRLTRPKNSMTIEQTTPIGATSK